MLENNVAAIIGAMIIAPMILPIGAMSFSAVEGDALILRRALATLTIGAILSVALAAAITRLFFLPALGSEIMARSQPNLLDLGVALAAGVVAAFARVRPSVAGAIAGTAIAVALMPPICVVGIAIAHGMMALARGAALLFVTNLLGIMIASMSVFVLSGYVHMRRATRAFVWTLVAITAIIIPLAASTGELIRQAQVESALRSALLNGTVTFQRVELIRADFDWVTAPPEVHLLVRSTQPITPTQVALLEAFARHKTGIDFRFVFDVTALAEVRDEAVGPTATSLP
ncbi:MAG TPA: DUF389 domain-containing protein [Candidatus Baltobacteraceae bacterium]|nr:DUF389 domain-containing protein [Candidatus Baltobacteraceae bacterium]